MDATQTTGGMRAWFAPAVARFGRALASVDAGDWSRPTPCTEWDVRALVGHVVDEHRWIAPLLAGRTIAEVEPELAPDSLGDDPLAAWRAATSASLAAVAALDDPQQIVHLSFGDTPAEEYLAQLVADHVIHTWDLARAIGTDEHLDPELVRAVVAWFAPMEEMYRGAGVIGPRLATAGPVSAQTDLLARFGRDDGVAATAVGRFGEAFDRHDVDAIVAAMTDDCVFESTTPPDGERVEGPTAMRAQWERFFAAVPSARFTTEEMFVTGHRVLVRWRFDWSEGGGGHVRGVDVFAVRDGLVAEKLSYVKG